MNPDTQPAVWRAPRMSRRDRTLTMVGVLLSLMLAALDQTIVAMAGSR